MKNGELQCNCEANREDLCNVTTLSTTRRPLTKKHLEQSKKSNPQGSVKPVDNEKWRMAIVSTTLHFQLSIPYIVPVRAIPKLMLLKVGPWPSRKMLLSV